METSRDENLEIFAVADDGSQQTNLNQSLATDRLPAWSLDRSRVIFQSNCAGSLDIWVMSAEGSNPTNMTRQDDLNEAPAWRES